MDEGRAERHPSTHLVLLTSAFFHRKSAIIVTQTKKYKQRLQTNITSFESLMVGLIKVMAILMISAKLATLGLLKSKLFEIKIMMSQKKLSSD